MSLPTYLELVNEVLVRLREPTVTTVDSNALSKLIGKFVNDAKRTVEDAYQWNALATTLTVTTAADTYSYTLTGSGTRFKVTDVWNNTDRFHLHARPAAQLTTLFRDSETPAKGAPAFYSFNGVDTSTGDAKVELYPVPDKAYTVYFDLRVPQVDLSSDGTTMKVPKEPVILLAYARALVERGEDSGMSSSEAFGMYKMSLADYIAIEAGRYPEEETWEAT